MALPGFKVTLGSERVLSLIGHCVCVDEGHVGETFFIYMYINSKTVCFLSYQWIIWGGSLKLIGLGNVIYFCILYIGFLEI